MEGDSKRQADNKKVVSACKKVMFFKHHSESSDSESDDNEKVFRSRQSEMDAPDAESLAAQGLENVDMALTHSLFKSSAVSDSWAALKRKSDAQLIARRSSTFRLGSTKPAISSAPPKLRSQKRGLTNIISSLMNNIKLSRRYEEKVSIGNMKLTKRQVKLLRTAVDGYCKQERQQKIHELKANIASIDEKVRVFNSKRTATSPMTKMTGAISDERLSLGLPAISDLNENFVRFNEREQTRDYFCRWVRVVIIVLRWIAVILQISENKRSLERELKSFTDIATEIERQSQTSKNKSTRGLAFDKSIYVTNKEITLSFDVRRTLTLRSYARTPAMLQQVMHGLQTLESLAEYPLHIQEKLCKVAWYQQIEAKRSILRQGHFAEFFYFILSGQAFVKKMVENERTKEPEMHTVARLTKGQSFGEVALLYRTSRTATVESATAMELLMVSGEDFIRIFTRTGNPDEEPAYVTFLRQIPVLETWPIDKIKMDPGTCFLHYFKRGSVVTPNSVKSNWIFIIKAGCCEVLQKLEAVKPRCGKHLKMVQRKQEEKPILPRQNIPSIGARIDSGGSKSNRKVPIPVAVFDTMKEYFHGIRKADQFLQEEERKRVKEEQARKEAEERRKNLKNDLPDWKNYRKSNRKVSFSDEKEQDTKEKNTEKTLPKIPGLKNDVTSLTRNGLRDQANNKRAVQVDNYLELLAPTDSELLKMYTPIIDDQREERKRPKYSVRNGSVYVTIEILHARDVFGLNTLNFNGENMDKSSEVCLISRGAEIIMLSKKLFVKYADEHTRNLVKEQVKRYPSEGIMQMNLQSEVDWDLYRNSIVTGFLDDKQYQKTLLPTV